MDHLTRDDVRRIAEQRLPGDAMRSPVVIAMLLAAGSHVRTIEAIALSLREWPPAGFECHSGVSFCHRTELQLKMKRLRYSQRSVSDLRPALLGEIVNTSDANIREMLDDGTFANSLRTVDGELVQVFIPEVSLVPLWM